MCEQCEKIKEELWAEVNDLVNFDSEDKGPLSRALARRVQETLREPKFLMMALLNGLDSRDLAADAAVEAMRCMMISQRLAFLVTFGDSGRSGNSPTVIMGEWAGDLMSREMEAMSEWDNDDRSECGMPDMNFVRQILGNIIGEPENAEAEDA